MEFVQAEVMIAVLNNMPLSAGLAVIAAILIGLGLAALCIWKIK